MILYVGAYSAGKEEKSGSHTPFASSNSDWLLRSKSPITELTYLQWWRREEGEQSQVTPTFKVQ